MAGRHHQPGASAGRRSLLAIVVVLVVVCSAVIGTLLLSRNKPAATEAKVLAAPACTGPNSVTLSVQVSPDIAVPVTRIAQDWTGRNPKAAGKCVQVELAS